MTNSEVEETRSPGKERKGKVSTEDGEDGGGNEQC